MLIKPLLRYFIVLIVIVFQWDIQNRVTDATAQPTVSSDDATTTQIPPRLGRFTRPPVTTQNMMIDTTAQLKGMVGDITTTQIPRRPARPTRQPEITQNMMADTTVQLNVRVGAITTTRIPRRPVRPTRQPGTTQNTIADTTAQLKGRAGDITTTKIPKRPVRSRPQPGVTQSRPRPISQTCSHLSALLQYICYLQFECGYFENRCVESADLPLPTNYGCCLQCGCMLDTCSKTKTCCPMIVENLPVKNTQNPNVECQKTFLYTSMDTKMYTHFFHEYMLVSSCLRTLVSSNDTRELCEHPNTEEPPIELANIIPVTDPVTMISYRNKHCAQCNDVYPTVSWIAEFRSKNDPLVEESLTGMMEETRQRDDSFVTFVPPHYLDVTIAVCFTDLIEECPATTRKHMGHDYLLPYMHGHLRYKNILVAACNGIDITGDTTGSCFHNNLYWYHITVDLNPEPTNEEGTTGIVELQSCGSGEMFDPLTGGCSSVYCYSPLQLDVISRTCMEPIEPITPFMTFYIPLRVLSNVPLKYSKRYTDLKELMTLFFERIEKTMTVCEHNWFMTVNINFTDFKTFRQFPSDHDAEVINQAMTVIIKIDQTNTSEPNATSATKMNVLYKQLSFTWSKRSEEDGRALDDNAEIEGFVDENGEDNEIVLRTVIDYKSDSWLQMPPISNHNIDQRVHDVVNRYRIGGREFISNQQVRTNKDVYGQKIIVCTPLYRYHLCIHTNRAYDLDFMECPTFLYAAEQLLITRTNDGIEYIDIIGNKVALGFDQFKTYNMTHVRVCVDAVRTTNDASTPTNEKSTLTNDVSRPTNDVSRPTNDVSITTNDVSTPTNDVSTLNNDVSKPTNDDSRPTNNVSRPTSDAIRPTDDTTRPTDYVSRMTSDGIIVSNSSRPSSMAAINNIDIVTNVMILALMVLYTFFV